jgi:hypothetical protein
MCCDQTTISRQVIMQVVVDEVEKKFGEINKVLVP